MKPDELVFAEELQKPLFGHRFLRMFAINVFACPKLKKLPHWGPQSLPDMESASIPASPRVLIVLSNGSKPLSLILRFLAYDKLYQRGGKYTTLSWLLPRRERLRDCGEHPVYKLHHPICLGIHTAVHMSINISAAYLLLPMICTRKDISMFVVNENDFSYRFGDSGPKYLMKALAELALYSFSQGKTSRHTIIMSWRRTSTFLREKSISLLTARYIPSRRVTSFTLSPEKFTHVNNPYDETWS